ncbi:DNA-binding MarR family transcriptional regulator [Geodermatophilus bullaregiensis]|uniref:MarR family winged helix-turn-helix transcriptional regulator n=1 Tax=Geodermatophilus bullaregiensis TaxID=1564160 RepID=UPI00195763E4|nr:MarR family transcriptional regulator [Geodermatophilus bullaregiensis]MBM7806829.1 DNA-binding MarR family transcriptional regulator [Geodermatophilus bullaregiensis]
MDDVLLGLVRTAVGVSTRAAARLGGVSLVQLRALTVLHERPDASLAELARGVGGSVSTTSRLVDRLVTAGLADRRPSPASRRSVSLRLTPAGEDLLDRYDRLRLTELRAVLAEVPGDRRDAVLAALGEFTAAAGRVAAAPTPVPADDVRPAVHEGGGGGGGDPACWLHRVCPACGRLADEDPPTRCAACGEELAVD